MPDYSNMSLEQLKAERQRILNKVGGIPAGSKLEYMGNGFARNNVGQEYQRNSAGTYGTQVAGPTDNQVGMTMKNAEGANSILRAIDRFDAAVRQMSPRDFGPLGKYTGDPAKYAEATSAATDLMMRLKGESMYNLGVLAGPDMSVLEGVVSNPAKFDTMLRRGQIIPQLRTLASAVGQTYRSNNSTFEGMGGRKQAVPPLYQSPRSHYTKQQWGQEGLIPRNALSPGPATQPSAPQRRPSLDSIFGN